jgi:hypothetical protein
MEFDGDAGGELRRGQQYERDRNVAGLFQELEKQSMTDTAMTSLGSGDLQARIDLAERRQTLWLRIGKVCAYTDAFWVAHRLFGDRPGRTETVICASLFPLLVLMLALAVRAGRWRAVLVGQLARAQLEGQ